MIQDPSRITRYMVNLSSWSIPRSRREQPPYFTKSQIITVLEQVGILLQLDGQVPVMLHFIVWMKAVLCPTKV